MENCSVQHVQLPCFDNTEQTVVKRKRKTTEMLQPPVIIMLILHIVSEMLKTLEVWTLKDVLYYQAPDTRLAAAPQIMVCKSQFAKMPGNGDFKIGKFLQRIHPLSFLKYTRDLLNVSVSFTIKNAQGFHICLLLLVPISKSDK